METKQTNTTLYGKVNVLQYACQDLHVQSWDLAMRSLVQFSSTLATSMHQLN